VIQQYQGLQAAQAMKTASLRDCLTQYSYRAGNFQERVCRTGRNTEGETMIKEAQMLYLKRLKVLRSLIQSPTTVQRLGCQLLLK